MPLTTKAEIEESVLDKTIRKLKEENPDLKITKTDVENAAESLNKDVAQDYIDSIEEDRIQAHEKIAGITKEEKIENIPLQYTLAACKPPCYFGNKDVVDITLVKKMVVADDFLNQMYPEFYANLLKSIAKTNKVSTSNVKSPFTLEDYR